MARLVLALPVALDAPLASEAARHGHELLGRASGAAEAASFVSSLHPDTLVVAADPRYLDDQVLAACDEHGTRVVALTTSDADRRFVAALGLYETTDATAPWSTVELAIAGPIRPTEVSAPRARGTVITVWGPAGAPGRTTLAIGVASELAALGHSVVLADVDSHGASVAPALGMLDEAPGFAAACRLAASDALTTAELERIAQRYESPLGGFRVLTGIGRPSRWPELSAARVAAVIAQCRAWADFTVLDASSSLENDEELSSDLFAPRRNAATVTAVRDADRILAVGRRIRSVSRASCGPTATWWRLRRRRR